MSGVCKSVLADAPPRRCRPPGQPPYRAAHFTSARRRPAPPSAPWSTPPPPTNNNRLPIGGPGCWSCCHRHPKYARPFLRRDSSRSSAKRGGVFKRRHYCQGGETVHSSPSPLPCFLPAAANSARQGAARGPIRRPTPTTPPLARARCPETMCSHACHQTVSCQIMWGEGAAGVEGDKEMH